MKDSRKATIVAAINAYMQEEAKEVPQKAVSTFIFSSWKVFGLQELMRSRTSIQQRVRQ